MSFVFVGSVEIPTPLKPAPVHQRLQSPTTVPRADRTAGAPRPADAAGRRRRRAALRRVDLERGLRGRGQWPMWGRVLAAGGAPIGTPQKGSVGMV